MATVVLIPHPLYEIKFGELQAQVAAEQTLCEKIHNVALPRILLYGQLFLTSLGHGVWDNLVYMPRTFRIAFHLVHDFKVALILWIGAHVVGIIIVTVVRFTKGLQTLPGALLNYVDAAINTKHIKAKETSIDVSHVPADVKVNDLVTMFDQINFDNPNSPNYMAPSSRQEGEVIFSREELRAKLEETFVHNINNRVAFLGTPSSLNMALLEKFYEQIEKALRFCIHKVNSDFDAFMETRENKVPKKDQEPEAYQTYRDLFEAKARLAIDMAIAGVHCGGRYMGDSMDSYLHMKGEVGGEEGTLGDTLERILADTRMRIARAQIETYNPWQGGPFDTHFFAAYMDNLGQTLGLPGTEGVVESLQGVDRGDLLHKFFHKDPAHPDLEAYTPALIRKEIQERIKVGHALTEALRLGEEAQAELDSGEAVDAAAIARLQGLVAAGKAVKSSPEAKQKIAISAHLKDQIFGWLKNQARDWKKEECDAKIASLESSIQGIADSSAAPLFTQTSIFRDLMLHLHDNSVELPEFKTLDGFVTEVMALDEAKAFLNERLQLTSAPPLEKGRIKTAWKEAICQSALEPHLKAFCSGIASAQRDLPPQVEKVSKDLAWVGEVNRILLAAELPAIDQETLLRCRKGETVLKTVLQDRIYLARDDEFMTEALKIGEDEDPALSVAKDGLKPEVLEWILVKHEILNPPEVWVPDDAPVIDV